MDLPLAVAVTASDRFACPYCEADLGSHVLSCRSCGRDLTPVLPLLRRLREIETRLATIEERVPQPPVLALVGPSDEGLTEAAAAPSSGRRRPEFLGLGFAALLASHWLVVIWLDLPLLWLRLASIVIPLAAGFGYLGWRGRLSWLDVTVTCLFSVAAVAAMNVALGWVDAISAWPQGTAAWRESFFYALSIAASLLCGMLVRVSYVALSSRGLTSLPRLREGVAAVNGKVPMDTLKAIELTILLLSTVISAVTGLVAGLIGVSR